MKRQLIFLAGLCLALILSLVALSSPYQAWASADVGHVDASTASGTARGRLEERETAYSSRALQSASSATTRDFNGDGKADILWRNSSSGQNAIWFMSGTTVLPASNFITTIADPNWKAVGVADFSGDGKADILWRNSSTGDNALWLMSGTTLLSPGVLPAIADTNWKVAGVGDFNGDGKADILWRNSSSGQNAIWFMNGTTVLPASASITPISDTNWKVAGVGDFDADGKSDILWRNSSNGQNAIWFMNGTTVLPASALITPIADTTWNVAGVGYFDGDNKSDILWRNSVSGQNAIWFMNGATVASGGFTTTVADQNWKPAEVADFDGDNKSDILWRNTSNGQNGIWLMTGTVVLSSGAIPTLDPTWLVVP